MMKVLPVVIDQDDPKLRNSLGYGDIFTIDPDDRVPNNDLVRDKTFIAVPADYKDGPAKLYWEVLINNANK